MSYTSLCLHHTRHYDAKCLRDWWWEEWCHHLEWANFPKNPTFFTPRPQSLDLMHAGRTGNTLLREEGSEKEEHYQWDQRARGTSSCPGPAPWPWGPSPRSPGRGVQERGMKTTETNLVFFLSRPTVSPFEVSLTSPRNSFRFLFSRTSTWGNGLS